MARFDLYSRSGYLLDVQSNIIPNVGTRLVVPLVPVETSPPAMRRLHPTFSIDGRLYVMATHLMGAVPNGELGAAVGSLDHEYDAIVTAMDMIFLGF